MTTPETTMSKSGASDQRPMTWCQLKSRALPGRPRRNHTTPRSYGHFHRRGHHR